MEFCAFKTFDQLPKNNLQILTVDWIFWSTEKSQKIWSTDYESFNQLKKHNFDQVNFGQTTPCRDKKKLLSGICEFYSHYF